MATIAALIGGIGAAAYFIGIFAAPALMGFALWRSQSVPRWLAVLFFAGLELAQQLRSIGPVRVIVLTLPFAVAMAEPRFLTRVAIAA